MQPSYESFYGAVSSNNLKKSEAIRTISIHQF